MQKLLAGLEPHKATGPDEIPGRLLKELSEELAPVFRLLFKASLDQGTTPEELKTVSVVPIFKKGDGNKPENYRSVSLTAITSKLFEHIIGSHIIKHMDHHYILTDTQHGFCKRRSCETRLILTVQDLTKNIVPHHCLLH